jgi:hypothetical protein
VDAITAVIIRRLGLLEAVTAVCGPLHTPQATMDLLAQRYLEMKSLRSSGNLGWRDGRLTLTEISSEQWKNAQKARKEEWEWARKNLTVIASLPSRDLSEAERKMVEMVGTPAVAPVFAANGHDLPLISEDFGLRLWAAETMNVRSAWLQPCLMVARDREHLSLDDYRKAVNEMVVAGFDYISLDVGCLIYALHQSDYDPTKIEEQLQVLGGIRADVPGNLGVAAMTIDALTDEPCALHRRLRVVSEIARQFTYPRWTEASAILGGLLSLCKREKFVLREHLAIWLLGHSMGQ